MLRIAPAIARLRRRAAGLAGSERGAIAPVMALLMLALIGCVGIALDTGRSMVVKERLVSALDAAGLAVGARTTTTDYTADARKFVDANFKANYAQAKVTDVTATLSSDKSTITLSATAEMPTVFMKLFGSKTVVVKANAEVTRASTGLELVMVLDNTGSMEISSSMPALKTGAKSLVEGLFTDDPDDVYIGLVPFSQAVSIGPLTSDNALVSPATWTDITTLARTGYPTYWTGCVEARRDGLDQTDDPPALTDSKSLFKAYYAPSTSSNYWLYYGFYPVISYSSWNSQRGPGAYCPKPMTPMTNTKSKIISGIDAMTAQGSTFINLGAVWGWRMLSPRWRGFWGGDMAAKKLPLDYKTKNMNKALVLMTDGENSFGDGAYTAYGYLSERRLGTSNESEANTALDTRLSAVCNSMKQNNIMVITIAYDDPPTAIKTLLQNCATNTSLYFDAKNTSDLIAKFDLIRGALSRLRVSK